MDTTILYDQLRGQDVIEWIGLITGLLYVLLAAYEKPLCWVFGIISSAAIAWKSFTDYFLIADGFLQIFYVVMGLVGLWSWWRGRGYDYQKPITKTGFPVHLIAVVVCLSVSFPVSWLLIHLAAARYGYIDTGVTLLSVWATVLLIRKDLYNWVYWVILDAVLVYLYFVSGALLFSLLFLLYTFLAIFGWRKWYTHYHQLSSET